MSSRENRNFNENTTAPFFIQKNRVGLFFQYNQTNFVQTPFFPEMGQNQKGLKTMVSMKYRQYHTDGRKKPE